jgi:hypothetical protein
MRKGNNPTNHKIKSNDWNTPLEAFQLIFKYVDRITKGMVSLFTMMVRFKTSFKYFRSKLYPF